MNNQTFDTIVVGAGSAGCVLAARLSEDPTRRVLLLEAGGELPLAARMPSEWTAMFNTDVDWSYHTVAQAGCRGRRIYWPRGRMIGGSGSLNAMIYMRGLASDYDAWEEMGCPGWGWKDVLPSFIASENNARFAGSPWHGQAGPLPVEDGTQIDRGEQIWLDAAQAAGHPFNEDFNGESQVGVGLFQFTIRNGERCGTAKAYLEPARGRDNLTVMTGVMITRLVLERGRAVGVEYLVNGRPEIACAASEVVLSAGALASPHLLMLSGIGASDELSSVGITPVHDLPGVGKDLQDHINIQIAYAAREPIGLGALSEDELSASLREWHESRTGLRTSTWIAAGGHVCSRPGIEPDLQLYGSVSAHRDLARFLYPRSGFTLHSVLQRPQSRGEIRLRSANPLDLPLVDPRYFDSDPTGVDLGTLVEGVKINRAIAASKPLADVISNELSPSAECRTDEEIAWHVRGHCSTLFHPSSTCRMGTDAMAVVDPVSMKVHGLEGLVVADASVIPKMVSANLNATTIMVAERAAQALRGTATGRTAG